jgi:hypothetical protein
VTRFWPAGLPIAVTCDALLTPVSLRWHGHRHPIAAILDRWRVDEGWWRRRIWREYFTLTTHTGLLILIYHDVRDDTWRLQRVYD